MWLHFVKKIFLPFLLDEQLIAAKEEFKNIVRNFLTQEAKKIEGRVEDQIKAAVDTLNNKIDPMIAKSDLKVKKR